MTTAQWRLDLPITKPLSMNERLHYRQRAERNAIIRELAHLHARNAGIPRMTSCEVELHYVPRQKRRIDEDNYVATLKPACDGLVLAGIVADDTPEFMTKRMPVIDPPDRDGTRRSRIYLIVTERDQVRP